MLSIQSRLIVLLVGVFTITSVSAETMYVRALKCKMMTSPNFKAEMITVLKKGDQVTVEERKASWVKVKTEQYGSGWVSKFLLTANEATVNRKSILKFSEEEDSKVRKRASVITTAAAARGLSAREEETLNLATLPGQDFEALKLMESFRPSQAEIDAYIESMASPR